MDSGLLARLRERGVLRVAASYAVIAWLALQIADVTFDPLGLPKWIMTALIVAAVIGFPVAIALAWFYEVDDHGVQRDTAPAGDLRPTVHGKRRYADLVVIGVLLLAVAVLLVRQSDIGKPPVPANPAIAVLPFENLSGDPQQEYFSDGLAEEVLDRLGRVPGLKVIASSSSFSYKGKHQDAKTIASQLGVTTVLEGSVRRDGRKLKVNAKLIDGQTGFQLWSGSFDREVTDVFDVQAELAAAVIDAIVPAARGDFVATPPPTRNLDAHDHYLLGLAGQRARTPQRIAESVAHLEQAVALDPSYAQAQAALANSLVLLNVYSNEPSAAHAPARAEQAAYKALALDPSLSDAHGALGNVLRIAERPGAEEEYLRALELNPNNAIVVHDYSVYLSYVSNREADAWALSDRLLELDPRSPNHWTNVLGRVLSTQGAAAYREQFARALQIFEGDVDGLVLIGVRATGEFPLEAYRASLAIDRAGNRTMAMLASVEALTALGQYDESIKRIETVMAAPGIERLSVMPSALLAVGLKGDFERLEKLLNDPARAHAFPSYRHASDAFWYSVQGRYAEARAALEKAGDVNAGGGGPMGSSLELGALPALVRLYRAEGREADAAALNNKFREWFRTERKGAAGDAADNVLLAGSAIVSGERAAAVRYLQAAMKQVPIPNLFYPQLPWFKSLEGEPGYADVVAELERRRAEILAEIAVLEAASSAKAK